MVRAPVGAEMGDAMKITWRPMESAPMGGIVLLRTDAGVTAGYWSAEEFGWRLIGPSLGGFGVHGFLVDGWHPLPDAAGRFPGEAVKEVAGRSVLPCVKWLRQAIENGEPYGALARRVDGILDLLGSPAEANQPEPDENVFVELAALTKRIAEICAVWAEPCFK